VEQSNWYEAVNEMSFRGASLPELEVHQDQSFNPWLAVDVIGSPRLTGFIGCLMLELGDELEALDLSAPDGEQDGEEDALISTYEGCKTLLPNESQDSPTTTSQGSFYIAALISLSPKHRRSQMPGPLDELSPFPQPQKRMIRSPDPETGHLLHLSSLKMKELECKTKIKNLGLLDRAEMIDLVENMRSIAQRHYQLDNFQLAGNWWRRVVTYSRKISEYPLVKVLEACLCVIDNHLLQGKPIEARDLHQGVHKKMMSLFHPEHGIILFSKQILASILGDLGEYESQGQQRRELVQICLLKYGARNEFFVCLLAALGLSLFLNDKFKEAETILCMYIQLDREVSGYADKCQADRENTVAALCDLAELLNCQERYGESSKILDFAEEQFKDLVIPGSFYGNRFCCRKADSLYAKGDLLGCEELLRTTLKHTPSPISWDSVNSMEKLAELLEDSGRGIEALSWRERIFLMEIQMCGVEHRWSRKDCKTLGFCYANLGRYDDAVYHFRQTIEKLSLDQEGSPESRSAYAGTLHEWIRQVEEMEGKQRL
jgi:tetratricopeptide (TPR) repeat protein